MGEGGLSNVQMGAEELENGRDHGIMPGVLRNSSKESRKTLRRATHHLHGEWHGTCSSTWRCEAEAILPAFCGPRVMGLPVLPGQGTQTSQGTCKPSEPGVKVKRLNSLRCQNWRQNARCSSSESLKAKRPDRLAEVTIQTGHLQHKPVMVILSLLNWTNIYFW